MFEGDQVGTQLGVSCAMNGNWALCSAVGSGQVHVFRLNARLAAYQPAQVLRAPEQDLVDFGYMVAIETRPSGRDYIVIASRFTVSVFEVAGATTWTRVRTLLLSYGFRFFHPRGNLMCVVDDFSDNRGTQYFGRPDAEA